MGSPMITRTQYRFIYNKDNILNKNSYNPSEKE